MMHFKQLSRTHGDALSLETSSEEVKEQAQKRAEGLKEIYDARAAADANFAKAPVLSQLHEQAVKDREVLEEEKRNSSHDQRKKKNAKKQAKIQAIHDYLVEYIGDADWTDVALSCDWRSLDTTANLAQYSCLCVQQLMIGYISAPSSFTKTGIKNIASQIRQLFDNLYESDFFSYSFLSEDDTWENALRQYAIEELPPAKLLSSKLPFFELRAPGAGEGVFKHLVSQSEFGDAFALALSFNCDIRTEVLFRAVREIEPVNHTFFSEEDFEEVTRNYFRHIWDNKR